MTFFVLYLLKNYHQWPVQRINRRDVRTADALAGEKFNDLLWNCAGNLAMFSLHSRQRPSCVAKVTRGKNAS